MNIPEYIKNRRLELGLTLEELSIIALGYSNKNYIHRVEQRKLSPTLKTLQKILDALNCELEIKPRKK